MNQISGTVNNDSLIGGVGDDSITGGFGNDILYGGGEEGNPTFIYSVGGRDTLSGGFGSDFYGVSSTTGGGSQIEDVILAAEPNSMDLLLIIAPNTNVYALVSNDLTDPDVFDEIVANPDTYGDSAVELSLPQEGIIGLQKSGTNLIIDINRDGVAETENDITVIDYFDEQGNIGEGSMLAA